MWVPFLYLAHSLPADLISWSVFAHQLVRAASFRLSCLLISFSLCFGHQDVSMAPSSIHYLLTFLSFCNCSPVCECLFLFVMIAASSKPADFSLTFSPAHQGVSALVCYLLLPSDLSLTFSLLFRMWVPLSLSLLFSVCWSCPLSCSVSLSVPCLNYCLVLADFSAACEHCHFVCYVHCLLTLFCLWLPACKYNLTYSVFCLLTPLSWYFSAL